MNYISLDNLTRYHSKFKDYADAKYTLARDYGWKQTEKAGAVTCWPVGESRMKPVVEFLFKETLPVGDKSSQNPSTITGVSNIGLVRYTTNLFAIQPVNKTVDNVSFDIKNNGIITLNGTSNRASGNGGVSFSFNSANILKYSTGKIIMHFEVLGGSCSSTNQESPWGFQQLVKKQSDDSVASYFTLSYNNSGQLNSYTISIPIYLSTQYLFVRAGSSFSNFSFRIMVEVADTASEIDSIGLNEYVVPLGNIFYGGILDVSTGKLTITHRMVEADSLTLDISDYPAYLPLECTDTFGRTVTSTGNILALTGSTGGKIVYKLANPYTVQIDPVAITSLPQVDKYTPRLNTLYTDAENITVKYIKSPIRDEYEKVQAIIANGGTI